MSTTKVISYLITGECLSLLPRWRHPVTLSREEAVTPNGGKEKDTRECCSLQFFFLFLIEW